jgi:hypothetical protein
LEEQVMKLQIFLLLAVALLVAEIMGCGSPRAGGGAALEDARTILIAVDRSRSMYLNDPAGLGLESVQAMIAMAPPGTNFGIIAYGERAQEIVPVTVLRARKDREQMASALSGVSLAGKTDFNVVFKKGKDVLARTGAPEGSSLVLLTDGQHNCGDDAEPIFDTIRGLRENKWEVSALVLTPSRRLSFVREIAWEGQGETFHVRSPLESIDASLKLAASVDTMFAFLGQHSALTILPGTENLLFVAVKGLPGMGFISLSPHEGTADAREITRGSPTVYAYPADLDRSAPFDIVNALAPLPGIYEIVAQGEIDQSYVLCNLPVDMCFTEGSIKELYGEGEAVEVAIKVSTDNVELYDMILSSGAVELVAEPDGPGTRLKKALTVSEVDEDGQKWLRFSGDMPLFAGGSNPVRFILTATLAIKCAKDGAWHRVERARTNITPGGSVLVAAPMNMDFGARWSDEKPISREFEVRSMYPSMVAVKLTDLPPGFQADITGFDVTDKLTQKITLTLDPAKVEELGSREFQLLLANTLEDGSKGVALPVSIKRGVFKIEMQEKLTASAHPKKKFSLPIPVKVTPSLTCEYELGLLRSGTDKLEGKVVQKEDGSASIDFSVPLETPDGVYKGDLKINPMVEGLSARTIKVSLSVSGVPQLFVEPKELKVKATKPGWVEQVLTIRAEHYEDMKFGVNIKDVESGAADMLISGQYDAEFVPLDGWDGKKLENGKKYKAKLKFYISTDLQSGSYMGEADIWVEYRGGNKTTVKLPVTIELKR